jgi:hypothetical protein
MSNFSKTATEISDKLNRVAVVDVNAEWQRVNSYIADALKDASLLYSKLARLQGDFIDKELEELQVISENILSIGDSLSSFSKAFYEGRYEMVDVKSYRDNSGGGAPAPISAPEGNSETPPPPPPKPFSSDGSGVESEDTDYSMEESGEKEEKEEKPKKGKDEDEDEDKEVDYSEED